MARPALALFFLFAGLAAWSVPAPAQTVKLNRLAPDIGGTTWINSTPLTIADLKGRVVLVEFWTYG